MTDWQCQVQNAIGYRGLPQNQKRRKVDRAYLRWSFIQKIMKTIPINTPKGYHYTICEVRNPFNYMQSDEKNIT